MKKTISKKETENKIEEFFLHIKEKSAYDVKRIKKLAMAYKIKLGEKRKFFCKKCLTPYVHSEIKIKKGIVTLICEKCNHQNRWKFKDRPKFPKDNGNEENECEC